MEKTSDWFWDEYMFTLKESYDNNQKYLYLGEDSLIHNFEMYYLEYIYPLFCLADKYLMSTWKSNASIIWYILEAAGNIG